MASLPAAAPLPARSRLTGPPRSGRVVGVHPSCVYVVSDPGRTGGRTGALLAVETADGVGLPCALRLGVDASAGPFAGVRSGDPATVGDGLVRAGPLEVRVVRWWSPPPVRPAIDRSGRPSERDGGDPVEVLAGLLRDVRPPVDVDLDPHELLGRGPGLTPAGDDVLAGWLLAVHHDADLRATPAAVLATAATVTTALSAALLREAEAGRGVPAAVALADALGGHGEVAPALARLLRVGHTSGAALALGLLRGARLMASRSDVSDSAPGAHQSVGDGEGVAA